MSTAHFFRHHNNDEILARCLGSALLLLLSVSTTTEAFAPAHLQSGPDSRGPSYVSQAVYDPNSRRVHMVGTTYGEWFSTTGSLDNEDSDPSCFYGVADLPSDDDQYADFIHAELLGRPGVDEACHGLFLDTVGNRVYVVGPSEPQGILEDLFDGGGLRAEDVVQVGMVLDFHQPESSVTDTNKTTAAPLQLVGGRVLEDSSITYPVAISSLPGSENGRFFVASLFSDDSARNDLYEEGSQNDPSVEMTLGNSYALKIRWFEPREDVEYEEDKLHRSVTVGPGRVFSLDQSVFVTGLLHLVDRVVVSGYTTGTGDEFGDALETEGISDESYDGFVIQADLDNIRPLVSDETPSTLRVQSEVEKDDYVHGMCTSNPQVTDFIYVVGTTQGHINGTINKDLSVNADSTRAFLLKLKLEDMSIEWTVEIEAQSATATRPTEVEGWGCAVSEDGATVFFGGNVLDGALIVESGLERSYGDSDIFLAKVEAETGKIEYVRQIGSEGRDTLAFRGGILVDEGGNPIVVGNSEGQVYRDRTASGEDNDFADVIIFSVSGDEEGEYVLPLEDEEAEDLPHRTRAPVSSPAPTVTRAKPEPEPEKDDDKDDDKDEDPKPDSSSKPNDTPSEAEDEGSTWIFLLLILIIFSLLSLGIACFVGLCVLPKREVSTDRNKVLSYLHDFDVEDVDLKHSATGGWHCSYANDLARGINRNAPAKAGGPNSPSSGYLLSSGDDPYTMAITGGANIDPLNQGGGSGGMYNPYSTGTRAAVGGGESLYGGDEGPSSYGLGGRTSSGGPSAYEGLIGAYNDQRASAGKPNSNRERWTPDII